VRHHGQVSDATSAAAGRDGYEFDAQLWLWDARKTDTWTFVSLPEPLADEILDLVGTRARGFGSVRVEVTLGGSVWRTSLFPDATAGTYVLPVKKAVRRGEDLDTGDRVRVRIVLLDV
jgi:hypothetical protein